MFYTFSREFIFENLNNLLCQYAEGNFDLLFDSYFEPESFTAREKLNGLETFVFSEVSFEEWISNMLREQFVSGGVEECVLDEAINCGIQNFKMLLSVCGEDYEIYNQEVVDILRRISVYTLTGELGYNFDTAREFNLFAHRIMPYVMRTISNNNLSVAELLKLSIVSGLSGLDLKGATAAASQHHDDGIPMSDLLQLSFEEAAEEYYKRLMSAYNERCFPLFHFDELIESISKKEYFELVWMTDDIIESYFDLAVIERLLSSYSLSVTLVPKNGRFGNDASFDDICGMIPSSLNKYMQCGRFRLCNKGPLMAAANLRKLSQEHSSLILKSDAVVLKGCRISEMFNGGIRAHTYVAYSIVRRVSEKMTGYHRENFQ